MLIALPTQNQDSKSQITVHKFTDRVTGTTWADRTSVSVRTHRQEAGALALTPNGSLLASGSIKGTNVKIYSTAEMQLLKKLARGNTHSTLRDLCFSQRTGMLSLTSGDKPTIHVWRHCGLESYFRTANDDGQPGNAAAAGEAGVGLVRGLFDKVKNKIIKSAEEHLMWQVEPLVENKCSKICGFADDEKSIMVATEDGRYFNIAFTNMDEMEGCSLLSGESLLVT